jgi:hypothetical protein
MILIYLDESGTNYSNNDGLFNDGPFLIFGAICIYEDVYWSLERLFCKLIDKYFGINSWLNNEIHATDIWAGNTLSANMTVEKRREFFDEFLQLCGKFGLPYILSFNLKIADQNIENRNRDLIKAANCLLVSIEHNLAEMHQSGVLVCDSSTNSEYLKMKDIINVDIAKKPLTPAQAILKQFYEMTSWRSVGQDVKFTIIPKYPMEAMSAYLIDRVHFLHSDDSIFLQICDILTFIVQRALVHDYLLAVDQTRLIKDKVPCSPDGLGMMKQKILPCFYDKHKNDVSFLDIKSPQNENVLLIDLGNSPFRDDIYKHYSQMQPKKLEPPK